MPRKKSAANLGTDKERRKSVPAVPVVKLPLTPVERQALHIKAGHAANTPEAQAKRDATVAASRAVKTHCKRGHPYIESNLLIRNGKRQCRQCLRDLNNRAYRESLGRAAAADGLPPPVVREDRRTASPAARDRHRVPMLPVQTPLDLGADGVATQHSSGKAVSGDLLPWPARVDLPAAGEAEAAVSTSENEL